MEMEKYNTNFRAARYRVIGPNSPVSVIARGMFLSAAFFA